MWETAVRPCDGRSAGGRGECTCAGVYTHARMPRVVLKLALDPTSGAVCATLTSVSGRCPECTDVELPGWLVTSGRDHTILPEESESDMMGRMCLDCQSNPSSFCDGCCLRVSYEEFHRDRMEALCYHCGAIICGEQWAAVCTRCDRPFCANCVSLARVSV